MKKVNFYVPLTNGEGKSIQEQGQDVMMGRIVSDVILASSDCKSPARMYTLGMAIYSAKGEVEIEDQDWAELKRMINASQMKVFIKGPVMLKIEDAEEKAKKK